MQLYLNSSPRCSIQKKLKKSKMLYCSCHRDILFLTLTLFSFYESEKKFADPYHQIEKQKNKNTFTPRWPLETKKPQTVTKCISRRNKKKKRKEKRTLEKIKIPFQIQQRKWEKNNVTVPPYGLHSQTAPTTTKWWRVHTRISGACHAPGEEWSFWQQKKQKE